MFGKTSKLSAPKTRPGLMTRQPSQTSKAPTQTAKRPLLSGRPGCASCGGAKKF